jgi:hypothetical protein
MHNCKVLNPINFLQVSIIVMLTGLVEGEARIAEKYWNDEAEEGIHYGTTIGGSMDLGGGVVIQHKSTTTNGPYCIRCGARICQANCYSIGDSCWNSNSKRLCKCNWRPGRI